MQTKPKIAVIDDYQQLALNMANWHVIQNHAELIVFTDHIADEAGIIERLAGFEIICVMRERTPLTRNILTALPKLRLIVSTGTRNASIDTQAVKDLGISLKHTGYLETGAPELTWALLTALARHIPQEANAFKAGEWQHTIGADLAGKTIGILGLGRVGAKIAAYAKAFDMKINAWSQNLTAEKASEAGATLVSKEELFKTADFITIHLILSDRSRGIVSAKELALMKPSAYFINTSRGPLVVEDDLMQVLAQKKIAGAAVDVFDIEPLPTDHPFRNMDNLLATSHIGYVTENTYRLFYGDTVKIIEEWLNENE